MTKEDIIIKATEIAASEGYDRLTLSSLAESLGVRKASLYYHFASKEELIDGIYGYYSQDTRHLGFSVDLSQDADTVFKTALAHWKAIFQDRKRQAFISLVDQRKAIDERAWESANSYRLMIQSQSSAIIEHMMERGKMRIVDAPTLSLMFANTIHDALVDEVIDADAFLSSFTRAYIL